MSGGSFDIAALAQPAVRALSAYDPGHDIVALRERFGHALVEIGGNENPHGPSPRVREAILDTLADLPRYPDPTGHRLKRALAGKLGVDRAQIMLGNGSHELLMQIAQVFAGPGLEVAMPRYGFAVHALAAKAIGATLRIAEPNPLDHAMPRGHDLAALKATIGPQTRLVYVSNPNNPTGTWLPTAELESFLTELPEHTIAVVDEAYAEFVDDTATPSALTLLPRFPRLIVTRTFSKGYAIAGLRVGYLVAHEGLIATMEPLRESFNVNLLGLAAAEAALGDEAHLRWLIDRNAEDRAWLAERLASKDLLVHPSQTNFLLVDFGREAAPIEARLLEQGVVVRPMIGYGLPTCLRISVGTRSENQRLMVALDEALK